MKRVHTVMAGGFGRLAELPWALNEIMVWRVACWAVERGLLDTAARQDS